jgi:hypothetical protein
MASTVTTASERISGAVQPDYGPSITAYASAPTAIM